MAPGLPLNASTRSPARRNSQKQHLPTPSTEAPSLSLRSPRRQIDSAHNASEASLAKPEPEPAPKIAAHSMPLLPPLTGDMDVDDGTTAVVGTADAQQVPQASELPAHQSSQALPQSRSPRSPVRTPELQTTLSQQKAVIHGRQHLRSASQARDLSPGTPGHIPPFDWESFEARYEQALMDMNSEEKELLQEFDRLVKYFNVWASAGSAHDDQRAVKRLRTRERYVKIAEQSLGQRKQHLTEVVRAFQSALALLSQT
ncbi:hypothetical protein SEPCBS119000_005394 [Sporothrix epigloea]|uniref:Uncharacterized protein n=1 Tax=Sporothrix epigloea TaxID=1892477 RepID=A0ABP0DXC6_9PEZI